MRLASFLPTQPVSPARDLARSAIGAGLGIAFAGAIATIGWNASFGSPLLIAPMGASAVLLFGVPASPLAQPYAIVMGNLLAAFIGVTAAWLIPAPLPAAAIAIAAAIGAMILLRCVHPPSGAVALTAVLGGPKVFAAGYGFVAVPALLDTLLLVAAALVWNNLTGRSYPHAAHHPTSVPPTPLHRSDFEAVLADYGEPLDIDVEDLEALHEALTLRAAAR